MPVLKKATVMLVAAALCMCTSALAQSDLEDVGKVKDYYADWLSSIPGVTNVGVGEGPGGAPEIELLARRRQTTKVGLQCAGTPRPRRARLRLRDLRHLSSRHQTCSQRGANAAR